MYYRNKFCVKEVSNLPAELCGHTQYFGDQNLDGKCVYKKCSDKCQDGSYSFYFGGKPYERDVYCCTGDYCNSASSTHNRSHIITFSIFIVILLILFLFVS